MITFSEYCRLSDDISEGKRAIDADRKKKGIEERQAIVETGKTYGLKRSLGRQIQDLLMLKQERSGLTIGQVEELIEFYLKCGLKPHELETPESLLHEFTTTKKNIRSECNVMRRGGQIVSSVHATHDPDNKAAYLKFQATDPAERSTGISQILLAKALHQMHKKAPVEKLCLEGVDKARTYWDGLRLQREQRQKGVSGGGAHRAYGHIEDKTLKEIEYALPDLNPDRETGEDGGGGPVKEHFHSLYRGQDTSVRRHDVEQLITSLSDAWYIVDENTPGFTPEGLKRRNEIVRDVRSQVLRSVPEVYHSGRSTQHFELLSKELQEFLEKEKGYRVINHEV